jgi:hypothetical protein
LLIRFFRQAFQFLLLLPLGRPFDQILILARFCFAHQRLPTEEGLAEYFLRRKLGKALSDPLVLLTTDKIKTKSFIEERVGAKFVVPSKAILSTEQDIERYIYERGDVIKPTHASGYFSIIREASDLDLETFKQWLKIDYYRDSREKNYKGLIGQVIVEPEIFPAAELVQLQFYCFNGGVKFVMRDFWPQYVSGGMLDPNWSCEANRLYDRNWSDLNICFGPALTERMIEAPSNLADIVAVAETLATGFEFMRVDIYWSAKTEQFFVGELTHCPGGSYWPLNTREARMIIRDLMNN